MNQLFGVRFTGYLLVLLLGLSGCSSSKNRVGGMLDLDTDLKLTIIAGSDVNPDKNERPSPVFIRLYELKSPVKFDKADFIDLYESDVETIGEDLISKQVLKPMAPGEQRMERFVLQPGTRYVALYAEFSQYRGATYKIVLPVTENNIFRNAATLNILGRMLQLAEK